MFPVFNALLVPLLPALGIYTLYRRFGQKKSNESFRAQWGHITPQMRAFGRKNGPRIWLHAVSVGETMAVKPIAAALRKTIPGVQIALSSTTDTGHELAQSLLKSGEVDCCFYFPLDLAPVQTRFLHALRPSAICFVETELWPNLLHLARAKNIPTFLVNGRVSDNLLQTAPKLGPLWKWMSGNMAQFLMRGEEDARRLLSLGVAHQKVKVIGDVKLEMPAVPSAQLREVWRERLGIGDAPLFIAGSTHAEEEAAILNALSRYPRLKIAFAPRHLDRTEEVAKVIEAAGFKVARRSQNEVCGEGAVYLLDTIGELADFYAAADIAFVGGSLIKRGGHNVLEPVLRGAPVVFGPYMMNFYAAAELVTQNGLGTRLADVSELKSAVEFWLDSQNNADFSSRVGNALAPHQGAAQRLAGTIAAALA